jgi:hypothetical protein
MARRRDHKHSVRRLEREIGTTDHDRNVIKDVFDLADKQQANPGDACRRGVRGRRKAGPRQRRAGE